jgi:beta-N-acetylhexosaminidase
MIRTHKISRRFRWPIIIIGLLFFSLRGAVQAQNDTPWAAEAQALLETMSVEERVGQLFMVTFTGDSALPDSDIADLIDNYHVAGVVLLAENGNISDEDNAAPPVSCRAFVP